MMPKVELKTESGSRYEEIAAQLRRGITNGVLRPGDRLPSLRTLCRQHGVAPGTMEKAQRLLEKEGLIRRSHRSGVFVADSRKQQRKGLIGFRGVDFTQTEFSPYWTRVMEGVEAAARKFDSRIVLLGEDSPSGWDKVDGVLINGFYGSVPVHFVMPHMSFVSLFKPLEVVGGTKLERARIAANNTNVLIDDYAGTRAATEHLLSLGHRRIAYLNNDHDHDDFYSHRIRGYLEAMRDAGITVQPNWLRLLPLPMGRLSYINAGREAMSQWLREDWKQLGCTAMLVHNDDAAWGVIDVLREADIAVPDEVSVVGFDGTEIAECCNPQLTTVEVPLRLMGTTAVELLEKRINGEEQIAEIVLSPQLRLRASTAPPPG